MGSVHIQSNVKDPKKVEMRRAQIVAAAVKLFIKKGFHPTTTREIAKASGLSTGLLYEYVQSKEDILFLVCRHIHEEVETRVEGSLTETGQGSQRLREAIWSLFTAIDSMPDEVLLIYQESKSLPKDFLSEVLGKESEITGIFETLIYEGIADSSLDVDENAVPILAHQIVVTGQMWAFRRWALRDVDFHTFAKVQVDSLMHACGNRVS
ncbi:TetR/AcrR family transcriptional regulator [Alicyclobacillus sp. SO9]|uniref:TetR/AcrR family transcriptional regulator n=1 Tax=Alicyclobacillus sp. SO9 TaxID=2665646 RepID=UPI0018E7477E|nr:TetR/AcrR family transcriptional regulator [Alicyclobacillus sp. SO9]QQE80346.1 TetR/AcrR family transcriptional regulator [Alicyclobacillus sp. SO9]